MTQQGKLEIFVRYLSVWIALSITLGVALATVVGVLVEVPVMLSLVWIANKTRHHFINHEECV